MNYNIIFDEEAKLTAKKWAKSSPLLYRKLTSIILELAEHPRTGSGRPESLRGYNGSVYSRRLSGHERIIYKIKEEVVTVLVIQIGGHYGDK